MKALVDSSCYVAVAFQEPGWEAVLDRLASCEQVVACPLLEELSERTSTEELPTSGVTTAATSLSSAEPRIERQPPSSCLHVRLK